ncbi:thiamine biosynthesis protein ThiS [Halorhodospira abdelmalekii]|nr:thiamine biosynthesis protein ThiS [Halorhodospira abdelmalekii]
MVVSINGASYELTTGANCTDALAQLGLEPTQRLAVELNEEIVPRSQLATHRLQDGDRMEIIQAVGGG